MKGRKIQRLPVDQHNKSTTLNLLNDLIRRTNKWRILREHKPKLERLQSHFWPCLRSKFMTVAIVLNKRFKKGGRGILSFLIVAFGQNEAAHGGVLSVGQSQDAQDLVLVGFLHERQFGHLTEVDVKFKTLVRSGHGEQLFTVVLDGLLERGAEHVGRFENAARGAHDNDTKGVAALVKFLKKVLNVLFFFGQCCIGLFCGRCRC
mmetsp:Transcript_400/g.1093  ORF Transcript_400/g.1093 Transcript_400/m.1093 type:complete len:205 (+) Transcript_400:73-687(+)